MAKCSHCEDERVSRCSYADCPFEVEDAHRTIAVLKAENKRLTKEWEAAGRAAKRRQDEIDRLRALAERAGGEVTEAAHGVVEAFRSTAMKSEQLRAYHALIRALRGDAS